MTKMALAKKAVRWLVSRTVTIVALVLALWGAYTLGGYVGHTPSAEAPQKAPAERMEEIWTCSMHPQIRQPEPGACPICGMDLVPEEKDETEQPAPTHDHDAAEPAGYACSMFCVPPLPNPGKCPVCGMDMVAVYDAPASEGDVERRMVMSGEARALAAIETTPVVRRHVDRELRMVGMVEADETRLARVTAYVGGRLDRLHVRFTGAQVERGAPLAGLYSPELLTARAELLQAKQSAARLADSPVANARAMAESTVTAARERLRLWGLSDAQVRALESGSAADAVITISAPMSGTVLERHVQQGDYVDTGSLMFTVADLSTVWIQMKAYESDLAGIRPELPIHFSVDALPGETFEGVVAFVAPMLDTASRTVDVRVEADNSEGRLKPGMFARASLRIPVAAPEEDAPLLIPATAPLLTGTRAVAYVEIPDQERPTFEGRQILLGPRAGDYYVVKEGLYDGERVVVNGAFRIDSALQIRARPSMMQPDIPVEADQERASIHEHDHTDAACCDMHGPTEEDADNGAPPTLDAAAVAALQEALDAYIATQQALADDDLNGGLAGYTALIEALETSGALTADDETTLFPESFIAPLTTMTEAARETHATEDIEEARRYFQPVSDAFITLLDAHPGWAQDEVVQVYCPMAFDDAGAAWLQRGEAVRNPYFGASMLQCGVIRERYKAPETVR